MEERHVVVERYLLSPMTPSPDSTVGARCGPREPASGPLARFNPESLFSVTNHKPELHDKTKVAIETDDSNRSQCEQVDMSTKRGRDASGAGAGADRDSILDRQNGSMPPPKRRRVDTPVPSTNRPDTPARSGRDLLSPLSDELLIRILSFLPLQHLLAVAPVSHRFYHLSGDSQLWKALYYARFVLPRAMRIPGFRENIAGTGSGHKLHYSGRRKLWADGRRGGLVSDEDEGKKHSTKPKKDLGLGLGLGEEEKAEILPRNERINWKRQYKIRYNWSRGKCAVEELKIGEPGTEAEEQPGNKVLVKVIEGIAITADRASGLRAWHLKSLKMLAQIGLSHQSATEEEPTCLAIDDGHLDAGTLDVAVGFLDGSFGVWRLFTDPSNSRLVRRYLHQKSSNGELIAIAFAYPYLLTATESVLISLYTFDVPEIEISHGADQKGGIVRGGVVGDPGVPGIRTSSSSRVAEDQTKDTPNSQDLPAPYLLTSLNSHTSRPPLALSIRKMASTTIASIAYTFTTLQGWCIGLQDLVIRPSNTSAKSAPEITTTRIAYSTPVEASRTAVPLTPPATTRHRHGGSRPLALDSTPSASYNTILEPGPTTLCYTHPYLLATLPDNTLLLHMCTSNASSLSISRGIRLWGHTSGISDAEITARGKAVSVSSRGEEMRVWELEGRSNGVGGRSVEIRPEQSPANPEATNDDTMQALEERRNWVGFDDEMVIVLKEKRGGKESLMVYDFT